MDKLNEVIEQIKKIECPTGELENRVSGILADYNLINNNEISVKRDEKLDTAGAEAFSAITNNGNLIVLATSGMDDYVAKVVNVYMK